MWSRRQPLPADVAVRLGLGSRDKLLAWGELRDGGWAVATAAQLSIASVTGGPEHHPWSDVDRASFDPQTAIITLRWVDGSRPLRLAPITPAKSRLPQVVRERVEWSVLLTESVDLPGGRTARVAVRRAVGVPSFSQVVAAGVDLADPEVAALVEPVRRRLLQQTGVK
jgi:hypothetical protein